MNTSTYEGPRRGGYLPISNYGIIGDCRSAALVGVDGSIDWCCLPRFDSPSVFAALVGADEGDRWQIAPTEPYRSWQRYAERTNVLSTIFETDTGKAELIDFMPVDTETVKDHARPHDRPRIVRVLNGLAGSIRFHQNAALRPDYARADNPLHLEGGALHGDSGPHHFHLSATRELTGVGQDFTVAAGDSLGFGLTVNDRGQCGQPVGRLDDVQRVLRRTRRYWWNWLTALDYYGPYQDHVTRSALTLKLMIYAPTGALVAAPTTSLPEQVGGGRNWDYRFAWLRDSSFSMFTLSRLGFHEEARDFMHWLTGCALGEQVENFYTLDAEASPPEEELANLAGWRDSAPVRIGNGAADQLQLDVYGEVLDCAYLYASEGGEISPELWDALAHLADLAAERYQEPDASIWEVRGGNSQATYSKVMCWVALDRAIHLAADNSLPADLGRWQRVRDEIRSLIEQQASSETLGAFTQTLDGDTLDASALRLAQVKFLPPDSKRLRSTIDAVEQGLGQGPMLARYDTKASGDGLTGGEGLFVMCGFWHVDALAYTGRLHEAERKFERLLSFSSPLGLFSEEVERDTGQLIGNYPQAFSHLALVAAAINIERARRREHGEEPGRADPATAAQLASTSSKGAGHDNVE